MVAGDAHDPLNLRGDAPLFDAYLSYLERAPQPFTIPGHKQRSDLVGDIVRGDVPLFGGLDSVKLRRGVLAEAERRAACLWEADACRFSVGGSTHGNQALALAVSRPGDRVIAPRALHRSLLLGLVLAGVQPVWLPSPIAAKTGLPLGVSLDAVARALSSNPDVRAVFVSDPTYVGTHTDLSAIAEVVHAHDAALVVDAAWGPHFGFHPRFPRHALAAGADAMVISAHKALPAYSQAALVLAQSERIDPVRLDQAFEATHTTSPAGSILASIDLARALLQRDGTRLLGRLLTIVQEARERLKETPGLDVLEGSGVDPSKLVVLLAGTGADGNAVESDLIEQGMPVEMADRDTIIPMLTVADDESSGRAITDGIREAVERHRGDPRPVRTSFAWTIDPETVMTPRDAFFAEQVRVRLDDAAGRVSAELLAPYPPGIPVLAPGERITRAVLDALLEARAEGNRIAYASDPSLGSLRVIA